ncbi:BREX-1 system adenine-specific DNA-methyltransferase PglX [Priestia megaterium]|uniref:BREX-1 system adenine-specific DNA-methyltransferase PglX n=1 Tax=Priestia megaterium TaxID=1404 RepID=UPI0026747031|nr:BREX-1 system adenine-specific DNA-methyltransferase PglX [Priestia megaterium]WKU21130.1 BREX-1 system adenine-specific DNA-methyltransferase PglX [Priestia megaterium]
MNKKALKEFAVYARNELRNQIALRAQAFGITSEGSPVLTTGADYLEINGKKLDLMYRNSLQKLLKETEKKGYENVIEEVAYTWFNRLIAIRFMEVHNYLPSKVRVLSSETKGKIDPDILTEYQYADLPVNKEEVAKSIALGNREEAFRKLLVAQCNELHEIMPFLFEKVADYTELLLPETLLHADSLINQLVQRLEDDDFKEVEVIGWLYQYYMSERKEQVGGLKNQAVSKENLPIVTQLFTPKWIVQYMVQNSLGKLYDELKPENDLVRAWEYYLKSPNKLPIPDVSSIEDIKVIDPACGSGHILVYAFDLLYDMYLEAGYPEREIPNLILQKNIYGLDVDKRAIQMASFALMMKGQERYRRFLKKSTDFRLNIHEFVDSREISEEALDFLNNNLKSHANWVLPLIDKFDNAKQFGSLIKLDDDFKKYNEAIDLLGNLDIDQFELVEQSYITELLEGLLPILNQATLLSTKYEVVITNPPYHNKFNATLKKFMNGNYKNYKSDLFAAFIYQCVRMTADSGFSALMTPFTWMFISSHEKLREYIINNQTISSLIQLEYSAFTEATVPICTFVVQKQAQVSVGEFIRLESFRGASVQPIKVREAINKVVDYRYTKNTLTFNNIPGKPIAYWLSSSMEKVFKSSSQLDEIAELKVGLQTGDNTMFFRTWFEVNYNQITFKKENQDDILEKWFPCTKGGPYRKWYGNIDTLINWKNNGSEIKKHPSAVIRNENFYFKKGLTWSNVSNGKISLRIHPENFIFDQTGPVIFFEENKDLYFEILGLMNSKVIRAITPILSPSLHFNVGELSKYPIRSSDNPIIKSLVRENIEIAMDEWDSFETSWGFKRHPLFIRGAKALKETFNSWDTEAATKFKHLKRNEEEINQIFIEIYNLQNELTSEVCDEEITLRRADRLRDTKSFLSYCVGLMMGRYSLDNEGLAYAGGEWSLNKYQLFQPGQDGIIPLTDTAYFEDDIISRLQELLALMFGEETLNENLQWLAESLTMKNNETPVERLRRYFFDEFYQDHCKVYQKRPIYWMAESGKKKGFRALFYLHRYTPETLATMRFSYVQNLQEKLTQEQKRLEQDLVNPDLKATTKKRYEKQLNTIKAQQDELVDFDKNLAELANQRIALDLDDGVVVNYAKLQNILAKIK